MFSFQVKVGIVVGLLLHQAVNVMIFLIDKRRGIYFACDFNTREMGFKTRPKSEQNHNLRIRWDVSKVQRNYDGKQAFIREQLMVVVDLNDNFMLLCNEY